MSTGGTEVNANLDRLTRWTEVSVAAGVGTKEGERLAAELFDPDIEFSPMLARELEGGSYRGFDEVVGFFRDLDETLGGVRFEQFEFRAVTEDVIVGTTKLVATGRASIPVDQQLASVYEFRNGRVRKWIVYGSLQEALEAAAEVARA